MTTKKATHIGTCQVCFRKLKLPNGVIQSLNTKYVETYIRPIVELYSTMQNKMRRRLETWVVKELEPIEKG